MVSLLLGAGAVSAAMVGVYGLYRYFTSRSDEVDQLDQPTEAVKLEEITQLPPSGEDTVDGASEVSTPPPKRSPEVPPKPSKKRSPAAPTGGMFPTGFSSELQERLQRRGGEAGAQESPDGPPVANGESAISFDQPTTPAGLSTPTRNRGPANRRPPTKH